MLQYWGKYPALRLLLLFIAGVLLYNFIPCWWLPAAVVCFIAAATILVFINVKKLWLQQHIFYTAGAVVATGIVSCSYLLTHLYTQNNYPHHFSNFIKQGNYLIVQISEPPIEKPKSIKTEVAVMQLVADGNSTNTSGKLLVNFAKDAQSQLLKYGDVLVLNALPQAVAAPLNPAQFNYKQYLSYHNISMQAYVGKGKWKVLAHGRGNKFLTAVYNLREQLMQEIKKFVKTPDELGVAGALLLGNRDYVTPEINRAYAATGTLHLLSVSGLHVGMVFLILSKLLFFMQKTRRQQIAQTIIIIILIWAYACLTGLSPSVLRSATMFSMIAGGKAFKQRPNIYNILGSSALLLLILNPYVITDIGFQLSYLAVGGIVYLYPIIYSWIAVKNKILDWLRAGTAVSVAAQATTFPLALVYFHQFPNYFLLSNLVVIPVGYIQMVSGIIMFLLQWIPPLQTIAGSIFYYSTYFINQFIYFIEALPYSLWQGISITIIEAIAIYAIIFIAADLLQKLRAKVLFALLSVSLVLTIWNSVEYYHQQRQEQLVVYAVKNQQAISVLQGNTAYIIFDSTLLANQNNMNFNVLPYWWQCGIAQQQSIDKMPLATNLNTGYAFVVNKKKIVVLHQLPAMQTNRIKADAVILTKGIRTNIDEVLQQFETPLIVADASNKKALVQKWSKQAAKLQIRLHNVSTQGAYVL